MGISALQNADLDALFAAQDWAELAASARRFLASLDLDGFTKKMRITDGLGRTHIHVVSTLPANLQDRFRNLDGTQADPIDMHVNHQTIPLAWEIENMCAQPGSSSYHELKRLGIRAGWSVATRGEHSFSRVDVYSRQTPDFSQVSLHSDLLLFSCYLNDAARDLWRRLTPKAKVPVLTEREQQCLRWSASGKTSDEIGTILGISKNTVYFHLKRAASKFEVYGTRHAISRAMELRLI
jgi:DNA-binding CsgD family transcriptional regulator